MQLSDPARELIQDHAEKEARRQYLQVAKTWGVALGATNLAAVALGFVYIFVVLPDQAADQARAQINSEIAELKGSVIRESSDALLSVGAVHGGVEILQKDLVSARADLDSASKQLKTLMEASPSSLRNLAEQLDDSASAKSILSKLAELERRIEAMSISSRVFSTGNSEDEIDQGQVVSRTLRIRKRSADSELRIGYTDNLRTLGHNKACRWELRLNGQSCPSGPLYFGYYVAGDSNPHRSRHVVGYCSGLSPGNHTIQVWVDSFPDYPGSDCRTGWKNSTWTLEAEETQ